MSAIIMDQRNLSPTISTANQKTPQRFAPTPFPIPGHLNERNEIQLTSSSKLTTFLLSVYSQNVNSIPSCSHSS